MKIQSLLVISIICFFCSGVMAEEGAAVTGLCKDGTSYTGKSKRGACRGHDGVKEWYGDKGAAATNAPASTAVTPAPVAATKAEQTPVTPVATAEATGLCKDGTAYTGKSKRGGCRGHGGIKEWYADKAAPIAATPTPAAAPVATATATPEVKPSATAATGICKDGSEYSGKSKRGACRGHGGVKEWFADKAPAAEAASAQTAPAAVAPAAAAPAPAPATATVTPSPKSSAPDKVKVEAPPAGSGMVWVNTHSKIYHCEGTKFYGNTKEGEYMSEPDAQAKGFVANRKKVCNK